MSIWFGFVKMEKRWSRAVSTHKSLMPRNRIPMISNCVIKFQYIFVIKSVIPGAELKAQQAFYAMKLSIMSMSNNIRPPSIVYGLKRYLCKNRNDIILANYMNFTESQIEFQMRTKKGSQRTWANRMT